MDPGPFGPLTPSCPDLGLSNKYVAYKGQLMHSDINQLNFTFI